MIYTDSRYAEGIVALSRDARSGTTAVSVFREFPDNASEYFYYTWTERDRIDLVAHNLLGDPNLWWYIMDYNPEQLNPFNIPIGTLIRIPGV